MVAEKFFARIVGNLKDDEINKTIERPDRKEFDPQIRLQFGMMLLVNLGLGLCTPPVGTCLFVGCAVGKLPIEKAVKTIWPFYLAIFVALMLITFVPAISLTLPGLIE